VIAVTGERGNETHGGKTIFDCAALKFFALEAVCVRGKTVEIKDDGRLGYSLRLHHIEIERITPTPLYSHKLNRVAGIIVEHGEERRDGSQAAAIQ
jgi:hypothetical protein